MIRVFLCCFWQMQLLVWRRNEHWFRLCTALNGFAPIKISFVYFSPETRISWNRYTQIQFDMLSVNCIDGLNPVPCASGSALCGFRSVRSHFASHTKRIKVNAMPHASLYTALYSYKQNHTRLFRFCLLLLLCGSPRIFVYSFNTCDAHRWTGLSRPEQARPGQAILLCSTNSLA